MIPTQTFENYPTFGNNATKIAPDNAKMSAGFQPADTLPAEWMNWAWNKNSKGIQDHNDGLSSVEAEINNILSENGITPSAANNTQFFSALQKYGAFIMASSKTITGPSLDTGSVIRIMFTADITGPDATTELLISYNGSNKAVKAGKNGALVDVYAYETDISVYKYIQAYTTLEFVYDGTNFVIVGNPILISGAAYTVYANGKNITNVIEEYNYNAITSNSVAKWKEQVGLESNTYIDFKNTVSFDGVQYKLFGVAHVQGFVTPKQSIAQSESIATIRNAITGLFSIVGILDNSGGTFALSRSGNGIITRASLSTSNRFYIDFSYPLSS